MLAAWPRIDYRHVDLSLVESLTPTVHSHWLVAYMEMKQWCLSLAITCSQWPRPPNAGGIHEQRKAHVNTVALCKVCGVCFSDIIAGRPSRGGGMTVPASRVFWRGSEWVSVRKNTCVWRDGRKLQISGFIHWEQGRQRQGTKHGLASLVKVRR